MTTSNPAIELWSIDDIKPYAGNAKKHPPEQVAALAKSIKAHGWSAPIVVDLDGVVIAGHGRRLAAIELGLKRVPVFCRRDLSKDEADALRLADNRITSTDYDTKALQEELARLAETEIDLSALGFDERELEFLTADLGDFNDEVFVEDITEAVEEQKTQNDAKTTEIDTTAAPVADALGFKRVTVEQSRKIRSLMSAVETKSGLGGVEALLHALERAA